MNKDNFLFIKQTLRYLGFGEVVASNRQLEIEMQKGTLDFQLKTAACFDEWSTLQATLYFRKSDNYDMYFFTKYEALLVYDATPSNNKMQTFFIRKGNGVTFKEAFNLLQGRSVYKRQWDDDASVWIQLSFCERSPDNTNYKIRQFGDMYGYDLGKVLNTYPIRELQDETLKMNLIYSLQKGNLHPVTFVKANKVEKMFVAACPESKSLKLYPESLRFAKGRRKEGEAGVG